ncbi:MAG: hypothetical protein WCH60_15075 [Burkholderiales bacterium]
MNVRLGFFNPGGFIHCALRNGLAALALALGVSSALAQTNFSEGFESGNITAWTTGSGAYTRTVTNVAPATGAYSLALTGGTGNGNSLGGTYFDGISRTIAASTPTYIGFYAKTASTAAIAGYFFVGDANIRSNFGVMNFVFTRTGEMLVSDGWSNYSGGSYTANTWYHIEFKNIDWTARKYDFYVNGVRKQSGIGFRTSSSTAITQIQLGNYDNAQSGFDEIQIGSGPAVTSYTIATSASPTAGGSVSCTPNPVTAGGSSACTASANSGYVFVAWSGDCSGSATTCTLSGVNGQKSITASFTSTTPVQAFDVTARASGNNAALTLDLDVTMATADIGRAGNVYLVAAYPVSSSNMLWVTHNGSAWAPWAGGTVPAYFTGTLPAKQSIPILRGNDVQALAGLQLYAGYGSDATDMLATGHVQQAYVIAGTPTGSGGTVTGPNGATLTIPWGTSAPVSKIGLVSSTATGLVSPEQKAVSAAYTVTIADSKSAKGDARYKLAIPLTSVVGNPDKLAVSVRLTSGTVVPVLGEYDTTGNVYRAEFNGLVSGWNFQVVEEPLATIVKGPRAAGAIKGPVSKWATTTQWNACDAWAFRTSAPPSAGEAIFATEVDSLKAAAADLCEKYSAMGFREPLLWISSRYGGRIINIAYNTKWGSYYSSSDVVDTPPEDEEEIEHLGQIVLDYAAWKKSYFPKYAWTNEAILAHELFHAIQWGYDVRPGEYVVDGKRLQGLQAFTEGTATVMGMTYQMQSGFTGPKVFVRNGSPKADVLNGDGVTYPTDGSGYPKQDYFAYIAKKYGNYSFAYVVNVFEELAKNSALSQATANLGAENAVYNQAMDAAFKKSFGVGLSEVFLNYAMDRAYHLTAASELRDTDVALARNQLRADLFKLPIPAFAYTGSVPHTIALIKPLTAVAFRIPAIPEANKLNGKLPLVFSIKDGSLGADTIRIFAVPEVAGVAQIGQTFEVGQLEVPVDVSVTGADALSFFVVSINASLGAGKLPTVTVSVPSGPKITSLSTTSAAVGAAVTVNGTGFTTSPGSVTFNGTSATVGTWSDIAITTTVPTGATTGNVVVSVAGKQSNGVAFQVTTTPVSTVDTYTLTVVVKKSPYTPGGSGSVTIRADNKDTVCSATCTLTGIVSTAVFYPNAAVGSAFGWYGAATCSTGTMTYSPYEDPDGFRSPPIFYSTALYGSKGAVCSVDVFFQSK